MSDETRIIRAIESTGVIKAQYDKVGFTVTVSQHGRTGPEAKEKARPIVRQLEALLEKFQADGVEIPEANRRLTFEVVPNVVYSNRRQETDGYLANYLIAFKTPNVEATSKLMDELTSVTDAAVDAPSFEVSDPDALYLLAFQDALDKGIARFRQECRLLGLDAEEFMLSSWNVREGQSHFRTGKAVAMAVAASAGSADPPTEIQAGEAQYSLTLYLQFSDDDGQLLPALEESA